MNIRSLFNATPPATHRRPRETRGTEGGSVPVLLTPQSLITFPVATFAIKLIGVVVGAVVPALAGSAAVLFLASVIVGGFIVFYSWQPGWDQRQKVTAIFVGALNVLYLFAAAAGLPLPDGLIGG